MRASRRWTGSNWGRRITGGTVEQYYNKREKRAAGRGEEEGEQQYNKDANFLLLFPLPSLCLTYPRDSLTHCGPIDGTPSFTLWDVLPPFRGLTPHQTPVVLKV